MRLARLLDPARVVIDLRAPDRNAVIDTLSELAASSSGLEPESIARALKSREELGSTGMGDGVAIPHARLPQVARPIAVFARLKKPVAFNAIDERPVDLVCVVLLPKTEGGETLNALACVARRLRQAHVADRLRRAKSADAIYNILTEVAADPS